VSTAVLSGDLELQDRLDHAGVLASIRQRVLINRRLFG
jgi:hypothetical protein